MGGNDVGTGEVVVVGHGGNVGTVVPPGAVVVVVGGTNVVFVPPGLVVVVPPTRVVVVPPLIVLVVVPPTTLLVVVAGAVVVVPPPTLLVVVAGAVVVVVGVPAHPNWARYGLSAWRMRGEFPKVNCTSRNALQTRTWMLSPVV